MLHTPIVNSPQQASQMRATQMANQSQVRASGQIVAVREIPAAPTPFTAAPLDGKPVHVLYTVRCDEDPETHASSFLQVPPPLLWYTLTTMT